MKIKPIFKEERHRVAIPIAFAYIIILILTTVALHFVNRYYDPNICHEKPEYYPTAPARDFVWKGQGLVTLWFDTAVLSQFTTAYPMLSQANYVGALSVPVNYICHKDFMSWNQVRLLQSKSWEITAQSKNHICDLSEYNKNVIYDEFVKSKFDLEKQKLTIHQFVMPCGYDSNLLYYLTMPVRKYYESSRSGTSGLNPLPVMERYNLLGYELTNKTTIKEIQSWIDEAKKTHSWLILIFHQVDKSNQTYAITPETLDQIILMIKKSGLQVVTPQEALSIQTIENKKKETINPPT